jgi:hypothetical protein
MVLLSGAMRAAEFSGSRRPIDQWMAGRQLLPWAGQWAVPRADPSTALANLNQLRASGVIDDREYEQLRARVKKA